MNASVWQRDLSGEQAAELAHAMALGPDKFAWFEVSGTAKDGPDLAQPLAEKVAEAISKQMDLL